MEENIAGYRKSLREAKAENEVTGRKQRPEFFFFSFLCLALVRSCRSALDRRHIALDAHLKLGAKYRERLAAYEDPSASRPSHPVKRPLPVGIVQHPEEKTKKLAAALRSPGRLVHPEP